MPYDDEILEYLSKPENIVIAIKIYKYMERLMPNLLEKFWHQYAEKLNYRLSQSEYRDGWEIMGESGWLPVKPPTDQPISPVTASILNVNLLMACLEHTKSSQNFRFQSGIRWTKEWCEVGNPILSELRIKFRAYRFIENGWWPGLRLLDIYGYDEEFLKQMSGSPDEFVDEMVDNIWDSFVDLEPDLSATNAKLIQE